jgi:hypothetical protein
LNWASSGDPGQGIINDFFCRSMLQSNARTLCGFAIQAGGDFAWVARPCLQQEHAAGALHEVPRDRKRSCTVKYGPQLAMTGAETHLRQIGSPSAASDSRVLLRGACSPQHDHVCGEPLCAAPARSGNSYLTMGHVLVVAGGQIGVVFKQ